MLQDCPNYFRILIRGIITQTLWRQQWPLCNSSSQCFPWPVMERDSNVCGGISDLWRESLLQNEPHIGLILWPGQRTAACACKLMCALESRLTNPAAFAEDFKTTPFRGPQAHRNKYASFSSPYSIPYSIFCFNHSCSTLCPHERLDSSTCMKEGIHESSNKS